MKPHICIVILSSTPLEQYYTFLWKYSTFWAAPLMRDTPAIMSLYPSPSHLDPQVWDVSKRVVKFELAGHDGAVVTSLAVASDGLLAASGSTDKTVKVGGVRGGGGRV